MNVLNSEADERAGLPSASGADKLFHCPGSLNAEQGHEPPAAEDNDAATQGTRIHAALENDQSDALDSEETKIYIRLTEFGWSILREWMADNDLDQRQCAAGREERFWIRDRQSGGRIASAKLDRCFVCGEHGLALDFKTGFLDAAPSYVNTQLRIQALALWHEYPQLAKIRVAIAQVRFGGRTDYCDYGIEDLRESDAELLHALWKASQPAAPRYPGSWCRYCRAAGDCREAAAYSLLPVIYRHRSAEEIAVMVSELSPFDLAKIHSHKGIAEVVFKAVDARLKEMSCNELAQVGLCLKPNSPAREVINVAALHEILRQRELVTTDEFLKLCKIPIGETEKLAAPRLAAQSHLKAGEAKAKLADIIAPTVRLNERSPSLKPLP